MPSRPYTPPGEPPAPQYTTMAGGSIPSVASNSMSRRSKHAQQLVALTPIVERAQSILRVRRRIYELTRRATQLWEASEVSAEAQEQWLSVMSELRSWEALLVDVGGYAKRPNPVVKNGKVRFGSYESALDLDSVPIDPNSALPEPSESADSGLDHVLEG